MKQEYDHNKIEKKWQKVWSEKKTYKAEEKSMKSKFLKNLSNNII